MHITCKLSSDRTLKNPFGCLLGNSSFVIIIEAELILNYSQTHHLGLIIWLHHFISSLLTKIVLTYTDLCVLLTVALLSISLVLREEQKRKKETG